MISWIPTRGIQDCITFYREKRSKQPLGWGWLAKQPQLSEIWSEFVYYSWNKHSFCKRLSISRAGGIPHLTPKFTFYSKFPIKYCGAKLSLLKSCHCFQLVIKWDPFQREGSCPSSPAPSAACAQGPQGVGSSKTASRDQSLTWPLALADLFPGACLSPFQRNRKRFLRRTIGLAGRHLFCSGLTWFYTVSTSPFSWLSRFFFKIQIFLEGGKH